MWYGVTIKQTPIRRVCSEQVQRLNLVITDKTFIQHCKTYTHHRCQHLKDISNSCFIMQHLAHHLYFTLTKQNLTSVSKYPPQWSGFSVLCTWDSWTTTDLEDKSHPPNYRSISGEGNLFPHRSFACQHTAVILPQGGDEKDRQNWLEAWLARHWYKHD